LVGNLRTQPASRNQRSDVRNMGRDNASNPDIDMAAWTAESRAAQGLPPKVTDGTTLRRVAALIGSGAPLDGDPAWIEAIQPTESRCDGHTHDERVDDGASSAEGERRPPAA